MSVDPGSPKEEDDPGGSKERRPRNKNGRQRRRSSAEQAGFGKFPAKSSDGVVLILISINYMVDGTLGVSPKTMKPMRFDLDKGAGSNLIRREDFPPGWRVK